MEERCPDTLFIHCANTITTIMWTMNKSSKLQIVGLRHSVQAAMKELVGYMGAAEWENYPMTDQDWDDFYYRPLPENVNFLAVGMNHMAWYQTF